jgi:hypothetical protein
MKRGSTATTGPASASPPINARASRKNFSTKNYVNSVRSVSVKSTGLSFLILTKRGIPDNDH